MPRPHPCLAPLPAPIAPHHLSTVPLLPAPIGLASSASRPPHAVARIASTPLRAAIRIPLCRHRADSARIAPPITTSVRRRRLIRVALRRPHRAHRVPTSASPSRVAAAPRPWLARTAPHVSLFRRMREKGPLPGNIRSKSMHFEIKMATSSPYASISGRNRAIRDTWRANLAAKGPLSRRGARNHAWREDVASAARPFRGSGMRSGRMGFAPCDSGMRSGRTGLAPCGAGLACLPHAPPPVISLVLTASRKQAEQHKQLNAGIKIGSPNGDPIEELFGFAQRLPDALQSLHQANELALSYLDHSTRQRLGGYVIGLSGNSFTVDLYAALVDHATSIAR